MSNMSEKVTKSCFPLFFVRISQKCPKRASRFKSARDLAEHFCTQQAELSGNSEFAEYHLKGPGTSEYDFCQRLGPADVYNFCMERKIVIPGKFPYLAPDLRWRRSHLEQFGNNLILCPLF